MRPTHAGELKTAIQIESKIRALWGTKSPDLYDAVIQYILRIAYNTAMKVNKVLDTDKYARLVFQAGMQFGLVGMAKIDAETFIQKMYTEVTDAIIES
jgi:hypothetical protein